MPERGTAVCDTCGLNINGNFPDHLPAGQAYLSIDPRCLFDEATAAKLKAHHQGTGAFVIHGHQNFTVFLPDKRKGHAEVSSYCVIYYEDPNAPQEVPNAPEEE